MPIPAADAQQVVAHTVVLVAEGSIARVPRALLQIRFLPCSDKAPVDLFLGHLPSCRSNEEM